MGCISSKSNNITDGKEEYGEYLDYGNFLDERLKKDTQSQQLPEVTYLTNICRSLHNTSYNEFADRKCICGAHVSHKYCSNPIFSSTPIISDFFDKSDVLVKEDMKKIDEYNIMSDDVINYIIHYTRVKYNRNIKNLVYYKCDKCDNVYKDLKVFNKKLLGIPYYTYYEYYSTSDYIKNTKHLLPEYLKKINEN